MKKTHKYHIGIVLSFLLLGVITVGKAQTHEFAPVGARWYYNYQMNWREGYVEIESIADTIINGKLCKKLEKSRLVYDFVMEETYDFALGFEYVSQQGDEVLIYRNGVFYTLFDFSAKIGDSWDIPQTHLGWCADTIGSAVVVGKGVDEIAGLTLRYIDIEDQMGSSWGFGMHDYSPFRVFEVVGPINSYLLPEPLCVVDMFEGGLLRCYEDDEIGHVSYFSGNCDYINEEYQMIGEEPSQGLKVFPNPFRDQFVIHCDDETVQWVRIYNVLGQLVLEKQWTENVTQINLSGYAPGVYHILLGGTSCHNNNAIKI